MTEQPEQVQATPAEVANSLVTQIIIGDLQHDMQALEDLQSRGTALALEPVTWITENICLRAFLAEIALQLTYDEESRQKTILDESDKVWTQLSESSDAMKDVYGRLHDRLTAYRTAMPEISETTVQKPPEALSAAFAEYCGKDDDDIRTFVHLDFTLTLGAIRDYLKSITVVE